MPNSRASAAFFSPAATRFRSSFARFRQPRDIRDEAGDCCSVESESDANRGPIPGCRGRGSAGELWNAENLAAAGGLGNVKCAIAESQQVFEGEVAAVDGGNADACPKAELARVAGNAEPGELGLDAVGGELGGIGVGIGHDHEELVAAEAGYEISGTHSAAEAVGDGAEGEVAGLVAVAVVDLLEAIDVEHERGDAGLALTAASENLCGLALDGAAVERAGESVGASEPFEIVTQTSRRHPEEAEAEGGYDGPIEPDVDEALVREPPDVEEADGVGGGVQTEEDAHDDGGGLCAVVERAKEQRGAADGGGDGDDGDKGDAEIMVFRPESVADGRDCHQDGERE